MDRILVVEDADTLREVLGQVLLAEGYQATLCGSAEEALPHIKTDDFDIVLCDLKLPGVNGIEFINQTRAIKPQLPMVVMTAYGNINIAVEAMKIGATDFITKPFEPENLTSLLKQIIEHRRIIDRSANMGRRRNRAFITQNTQAEELLAHARKVAALSSPVLITGESGTGKELLARYIHEASPRSSAPFVAVNCGSMPSDLLESEFFGHEAGAFTGAVESRVGLFEVADGGSIFLDEIGNMPANLQTKLLRALQESEIKRLGSTKFHKINTRVISATNCCIETEISNHRFREDLFYRLGVVILEIPALRTRPDDIPLLVSYYLKLLCKEFGREIPTISDATIRYLQSYNWPGNVRELENAMERALVLTEGPLSPKSFELGRAPLQQRQPDRFDLQAAVNDVVEKTEREIIGRVLTQTFGNKSRAAELLGISYKTLLNKVKEYRLDPGSPNLP